MRKPLTLIGVLGVLLLGCAHHPVVVSSTADTEEIPDTWCEDLDQQTAVLGVEARNFATAVVRAIRRHVYGPSISSAQIQAAELRIASLFPGETLLAKSSVVEEINEVLRSIGISHLRVMDPVHFCRWMTSFTKKENAKVSSDIRARKLGKIGVVRVASFVVPRIRRDLVASAFDDVADSKALVLDLRNNGGGNHSGIVYLAERFVGPDKSIVTVRDRTGADKVQPFVQEGGFADAENGGGSKEHHLLSKEGYVEYRTSKTAAAPDRRPLYLLVDSECGSSCELFTQVMRDLGAAKILGGRTAGEVFHSSAYKLPWRGNVLLVPVGVALTPSKTEVEGHGVSPDVEIPACVEHGAAPTDDVDPCLDAALAQIEQEQHL